jgi:hypothetical protein
LDNTALKPTIFNVEAFKKDTEASKRGVTDEERDFYSMSQTRGWKLLVELKERVIKEMEDANKTQMANGMPFDEIGKNAVVINLAESIVDRLIDKVTDAQEACEADLNDK